MNTGRVDSFTARSGLDPRTVHQNSEQGDAWLIPTLKFKNGAFYWVPSTDTPDEDRIMAKRAGFRISRTGWCWTASQRIARKLIAFADRSAMDVLEPYRNPYDPYNPKVLPNDLLHV